MTQGMVIQGRNITAVEIGLIRNPMAEHSDWGRTRLSEELCRCWNWRNGQGRIKDMAARTLLLKLERQRIAAEHAKRAAELKKEAEAEANWREIEARQGATPAEE